MRLICDTYYGEAAPKHSCSFCTIQTSFIFLWSEAWQIQTLPLPSCLDRVDIPMLGFNLYSAPVIEKWVYTFS